jgi:hypothetical protein
VNRADLWIAGFLAVCVLLVLGAILFDRWVYRRLVAAERDAFPC